jgi:hypothetical protein
MLRRNTKVIGDITEAKMQAALLAAGKIVLTPFGDNQRYDLAIDEGGVFKRIQCKTGQLTKHGHIKFSTVSVSNNGKNVVGYTGQIEFFGVYCRDNDSCYLVPVELTTKKQCHLRVHVGAAHSHVSEETRMASEYLI